LVQLRQEQVEHPYRTVSLMHHVDVGLPLGDSLLAQVHQVLLTQSHQVGSAA
jgi:hypothetical protein